MKKTLDIGSRPAQKFSQKLRNLVGRIHPEEQRSTRETEYQITHTPDRPRYSIEPSEIPSDAECAKIILDLQHHEEEKRKMTSRDSRGMDHSRPERRTAPLRSLSQVTRGDEKRPRAGQVRQAMSVQSAPPEKRRLEDIRRSRRFENPRTAPKPEQAVTNLEPVLNHPRRRPNESSLAERAPTPYRAGSSKRKLPPLRTETKAPVEVVRRAMSARKAPAYPDLSHPQPIRKASILTPTTAWPSTPLTPRRDSATSILARARPRSASSPTGPASPTSSTYSQPSPPSSTAATLAPVDPRAAPRPGTGPPTCRMPSCDGRAVRSALGLCALCAADYAPRPSVFFDDAAALLAQAERLSGPAVPARVAHRMRIISPPESPREISVASPTVGKKALRGSGSGGVSREAVVDFLEVPFQERVSWVRARGESTALAYIEQQHARQEWNAARGREGKGKGKRSAELVLDFGELGVCGRATAVLGKEIGSQSVIIEDWEGSEYYLDDAYFASSHDEDEDDQDDQDDQDDSEEDIWLSTQCTGVARREDVRERVRHSPSQQSLRETQRKRKGKGKGTELKEGTPTSRILRGMPPKSEAYAELSSLLEKYSNEAPLTPNIGMYSSV